MITNTYLLTPDDKKPRSNPARTGITPRWALDNSWFGSNVGRTRGNSSIKSSPEEKAMMDTYNISEFRSFTRARQIAVALLFALTLAGPSRLWGQCQQSLTNMSFDKGSIIALTVDST